MKNLRNSDGQKRLFCKALHSALGSGSLSRKDRIASKENLQIGVEKSALSTDLCKTPRTKSTEKKPAVFGNSNQIARDCNGRFFGNDVAATSPSLQTSTSISQLWVEKSDFATIPDPWKEDFKIPEDKTVFPTNWYGLPETKYDEDMSPSFENSNHLKINGNHVLETDPYWTTSPSDLHFWVQNNYLASIQETLSMAVDNENDAWLKKNRLMALQQMQCSPSSSLSPLYKIDSPGEMFPDLIHNLSSWNSPIDLPISSTNSHSSESNSLDDAMFDGKYGFENYKSPLINQQEEWKPEWCQDIKDPKPTQMNFELFDKEKGISKSDGKAEYACENINQAFEKPFPKQQSQLQNKQEKNAEPEGSGCGCGTFQYKPSLKKKETILPSYNVKSLMALESESGFFDSHCHIDFLFNREKFQGSYADYMVKNKATYPKSYNGCIAVFCKPFSFAKKHLWQSHLENDNVWGAFGCHPKSAKYYDDRVEKDLEAALDHPKVKALGEIGLDYSIGNESSKLEQHFVFRRQLKIAQKRNLRLVIHCRDADDDTIRIMQEIVPKEAIFHLHCFTGNWKRAQIWRKAFPNVFIGITNLVTFPSAKDTHEVARKLPLDCLLLETDAPYFVPLRAPRGTPASHPGMAIHVAAQIAAFKDIPVDEVLQKTSANTRYMYNLP